MLKLFEIKIYPLSPTQFRQKVQKNRDEFFATNSDKSVERINEMYSFFYGAKSSFEDYAIGYIEILYWCGCLRYEAKIMQSKRYGTRKELQKIIDTLDDDIYFDEEMKLDKAKRMRGYSLVTYKPKLFTEKKHYMSDYHIGDYTGVRDKTNAEIAESIEEEIQIIKKSDKFHGLYLDTSQFDIIGKYIDYQKIFKESEEQNNG